MANPRRIQRLQKVIQQTIAMHIQRELSDPRLGLVSITSVKLSPDLSRAQIYWSCMGSEAEVRTCERGLTDALGSIQRAVAGSMQTRVTPRLGLQHDDTLQHAQRLEEIFTHLREERRAHGLEGDDEAGDAEVGTPEEGNPEEGDPEDGDDADERPPQA